MTGTLALPTSREQIESLIPHQGAMCLLDEVTATTADDIVCVARHPGSVDHPLRRIGRLPAVALCEYAAQAMAVHGGIVTRAAGANALPGWLVALRDVRFSTASVAAADLEITAHRLAASGAAWQYEFAVSQSGRLLASGRATVSLLGAG